eukprot:Sspe_Gene.102887::Locus_78732_Transcript_1_1_Confidence_1.000_Length_922::g.102887::m.102887
MGKLRVVVNEAGQLANTASCCGMASPLVVVTVEDKKIATKAAKKTLSPTWDAEMTFLVTDESTTQVHLMVRDGSTSGKKMGCYSLSISGLVRGEPREGWYILNSCPSGKIKVTLTALDFGKDPATAKEPGPAAPQQPVPSPPTATQVPQLQTFETAAVENPYARMEPGPVPPPLPSTSYSNTRIMNTTVENATINFCEIDNCVLKGCSVLSSSFYHSCQLHNCTVTSFTVTPGSNVVAYGGSFQHGTIEYGAKLFDAGGAYVTQVVGYP